jgi:hypothetical protein
MFRSAQALFALAHLAFCAAAIFARPSALIVPRFRAEATPSLCGRLRFRGTVWPVNRERARCRRSISSSMVRRICAVSNGVSYQQDIRRCAP